MIMRRQRRTVVPLQGWALSRGIDFCRKIPQQSRGILRTTFQKSRKTKFLKSRKIPQKNLKSENPAKSRKIFSKYLKSFKIPQNPTISRKIQQNLQNGEKFVLFRAPQAENLAFQLTAGKKK